MKTIASKYNFKKLILHIVTILIIAAVIVFCFRISIVFSEINQIDEQISNAQNELLAMQSIASNFDELQYENEILEQIIQKNKNKVSQFSDIPSAINTLDNIFIQIGLDVLAFDINAAVQRQINAEYIYYTRFNIQVSGQYEQIINAMLLIENADMLFNIYEASLSSDEGEVINLNMLIDIYYWEKLNPDKTDFEKRETNNPFMSYNTAEEKYEQ